MIKIRSARIEDAKALRAIYAPYVKSTAITFEYDVPSVEEFAERIRMTLEKFPYLVIERDVLACDELRGFRAGGIACALGDCEAAGDAPDALSRKTEIVGYCYAGTFKARAAYSHCVETSIYIKQGEQSKGFGHTLYAALESELKSRGILNAYACIASPKENGPYLNDSSQKFHEKMGYSLIGTFHDCGYKFGRWFNMIWMEKMLGEHK